MVTLRVTPADQSFLNCWFVQKNKSFCLLFVLGSFLLKQDSVSPDQCIAKTVP